MDQNRTEELVAAEVEGVPNGDESPVCASLPPPGTITGRASGPNSMSRWFHWRGNIAAVSIVPAWIATVLSPPSIRPGSWLDLLFATFALLLFFAGMGIRFWSTLYIGGRKAHSVVSGGPYSLCRNPLYIGSFFIALSAVFFFRSLTLAAGLGLATIAYMVTAVHDEERYLESRHGDAYREYSGRVPRYVPRWSGFRTEPFILITIRSLKRECRRALNWIWLPLLAQLFAHLRDQPWWPRPFNLP